MKQTYDIQVPESVLKCETCNGIIKTGDYDKLVDEFELDSELIKDPKYLENMEYQFKAFNYELGRPKLPTWVFQPHLCCLSNLKKIQSYKLCNWISDDLFDKWMSVNGGDYQLGRSGAIDWLWSERRILVSKDNFMIKELKQLIEVEELKTTPILIVKCKNHNNIYHAQIKKCNIERNKIKLINKIYPFSSEADKKKTNVDLASLITYAAKEKMIENVNAALAILPIGTNNCVASAMLIHAIGNPHYSKMFNLINKDRACCLKPSMFNKYLKTITTALRRTSRWPNGQVATLEEVAMCAYWEQCLGRSNMLSDWQKEKENRTKLKLNLRMPMQDSNNETTNEDYLKDLKISLREVMWELIPFKPTYTTWKEFCENRQSWLSSGSSGGEFIIVDNEGVRVNKRTYFESVPIEEMETWIDQEPALVAVASEKFEQSKARAIYGTKPIDYAVMAFAMMQAESNLYRVTGLEGGLVGPDEVRSIMRRVKLFKDDNKLEGLMLDYADFNIQHTLPAQALVFEVMKEHLLQLNVTGDIIKALDWCVKACLNQKVKFPNEHEYIPVVQGLFSGNRGTNFLNTLLNISYFKTANRWVQNSLNIRPIDLYNLHQGDDVWIAFKNRIWGIALYMVMKNSGFVFQKEKQLQDRSRGEFLRVLYSSDGAMGYVARSIGTLLIRPLQGEDDVSPDARCTALNSQIMIVSRRGLTDTATRIIWDATVRHGAKSSLPSGDTFTIPLKAIYRSFLDGGLDLGPPGTMSLRAVKIAPIPTIQFESPELFQAVARHTTNAWIKVISNRYKQEIDSVALGDLLHRINTSDSLRPIDKLRSLAALHKQLKKWRITISEAPAVTRNYMVWSEWLNRSVNIHPDIIQAIQRQIDIVAVKRDTITKRTRIETIIGAISSSPFKDIASAERALHKGKIASARIAIKCCRNTQLSQDALFIMDDIATRTSTDVLSRVISGVRGVGGTFEYKLHPIIMSWMNKLCLEKALIEALYNNIKTIDVWDDTLFKWQQMGMRALLNSGVFPALSHY